MGKQQNKLAQTIAHYLTIHLFLTLTSLPIIVAWGLPLSRLAPLGNFIFSPILFIFLLLSSAIFFCEILHIPHGFINWLLENTTFFWQWLLTLHGNDTLYAFSKPPVWVLLGIAIVPFLLITHPRMRTPRTRFFGLLILFCIAITAIEHTAQQPTALMNIPCYGGEVTVLHRHGKTVLIDPGCIGRRISAPSWVSYTLVPELITKTGTLTIDHLIMLKPGILAFDAVRTLCDTITIKTIYVPYMYGTLPRPLRIAWGKLYYALQRQNSTIVRINKERAIDLAVQDEIKLHIQPGKEKAYRDITYPQSQVSGMVANQELLISCTK